MCCHQELCQALLQGVPRFETDIPSRPTTIETTSIVNVLQQDILHTRIYSLEWSISYDHKAQSQASTNNQR